MSDSQEREYRRQRRMKNLMDRSDSVTDNTIFGKELGCLVSILLLPLHLIKKMFI